MATISQIQIADQTYDVCDMDNRQTTETINDTLDVIMANIDDIQDRFSNGVLKTANGGTALNAANGNALLRALGVAKTAGDEINLGTINANGWINYNYDAVHFSVLIKYYIYGANNITMASNAAVKVFGFDGTGLFNTNNSTQKTLTSYSTKSFDLINGNHLNIDFGTGTAQNSRFRLTPVGGVFYKLSFTLRS